MAAFDTNRTHFGSLSSAGHIGLMFTAMFAPAGPTGVAGSESAAPTPGRRIGGALARVAGAVRAWNNARATRDALNRLSNRELDDIGLARGDIDAIARGNILR